MKFSHIALCLIRYYTLLLVMVLVCAGEDHLFSYQPNDYIMSNIVRTFRCVYGSKSPFEDVIRDISCS